MSKQGDDLEAVRKITEALEGFEKNEQERIIRWAREKAGLDVSLLSVVAPTQQPPVTVGTPLGHKAITIKEFIESKNPRFDIHFATTVAYYYRFEAPEEKKKETIGADDLIDACRLVTRSRPKNALMVLNNAERNGFLDRHERGLFKINAVGENLVAMGLPAQAGSSNSKTRTAKKQKIKKSK